MWKEDYQNKICINFTCKFRRILRICQDYHALISLKKAQPTKIFSVDFNMYPFGGKTFQLAY